jgi:hypothetical protein
MAGNPDWLIADCLAWVRAKEAIGHQFTGGDAAYLHWRNDQHRNPNVAGLTARLTYAIEDARDRGDLARLDRIAHLLDRIATNPADTGTEHATTGGGRT